jgi:hypothetical protein
MGLLVIYSQKTKSGHFLPPDIMTLRRENGKYGNKQVYAAFENFLHRPPRGSRDRDWNEVL